MRTYLFLRAIALAPAIILAVAFLVLLHGPYPTGDIGIGCQSTIHGPGLPQAGARWHEMTRISAGPTGTTGIMLAAGNGDDEDEQEGEEEGEKEEEGEGGWDRLWDAPKLG